MKYLKFVVFVAALIIFNSCGQDFENLSNAANEIANYCNTNEVNVSTASISHFNGKNISTYNITIKNVKQLEESNYPTMLIASHCAKLLYEKLTDEQRNDKEAINVKIVKANGAEEFTYSIPQIKKIDGFIKVAHEAILKIKNKDYNGLYNINIDESIIKQEVFKANLIDKVLLPNEEIFNKITNIDVAGFDFKKENNFDLVEVYIVTPTEKNRINYKITFKNQKNPKIAGIWINLNSDQKK